MITIRSLSKKYGRTIALRDINVEFTSGKITALIGPNGSGKSTLIKCLLGLVKPTSGEIIINGTKLNGDSQYRDEIGYMPQIARYPENLKTSEIIDIVKNLRKNYFPPDLSLIESLKLETEMAKKVSGLSGGNRQKLSAALAFMFKSQILLLDEPTAGLDPVSRKILREKILSVKAGGKTVILTSHYTSEIESLSDDVVFLQDGALRYAGPVVELLRTTNELVLENSLASLMISLKEKPIPENNLQ